MSETAPLVEFFQLVSTARPPRRADRAVGGIIPTRAFRYCEAITSASGFGWYIFLPMSFKVMWDGHDILWTYDGVSEWLPLSGAAQYPNFSSHFDEHAPAHSQGFSPSFLARSVQPGGLQIWTGCIARTAPGWSLLVRGVANLPKSLAFETLEGIIETDHWFGPLFDNVRILKTDTPIEFRNDIPFLQIQPVRREVYEDRFLRNFAVKEMHELSAEDWEGFRRTVVVPNTTALRKRGAYAVGTRKREAAPIRA